MRSLLLPALLSLTLAGCDLGGGGEEEVQDLSGAAAFCQSWLPLVLIGVDAQIEVSDSADCEYAPAVDPSGDELPMPHLEAAESGEHVEITGPDNDIIRWVLAGDQRAGFADGVHLDLPAPHGGSFAASGHGEPTSWLQTRGGELTDIAMQGEHARLDWRTPHGDLVTDNIVATRLKDGLPQSVMGLGHQAAFQWGFLEADLSATGVTSAQWEDGELRTIATSTAGGTFVYDIVSPGGVTSYSKWTGYNGGLIEFAGGRYPTNASGPITGQWYQANTISGSLSADAHLTLDDLGFPSAWDTDQDQSKLDVFYKAADAAVLATGPVRFQLVDDNLTQASVGPAGLLSVSRDVRLAVTLDRNLTLVWPYAAELTVTGQDCGSGSIYSQDPIIHTTVNVDCPVDIAVSQLGPDDGSKGGHQSPALDAVTPSLSLRGERATGPIVVQAPSDQDHLLVHVEGSRIKDLVVDAPAHLAVTLANAKADAIHLTHREGSTAPDGLWVITLADPIGPRAPFESLHVAPGGSAVHLTLPVGFYDFDCGATECTFALPNDVMHRDGATLVRFVVDPAAMDSVVVKSGP